MHIVFPDYLIFIMKGIYFYRKYSRKVNIPSLKWPMRDLLPSVVSGEWLHVTDFLCVFQIKLTSVHLISSFCIV